MRKTPLLLLAAASALLAGCGSGGGLMGRDRPDEFAVQRQAPLVIPPDFSLVPPQPGAPRPADANLQQQTLEALFGGPQAMSAVERDALARAGEAAPGIRSSVGDPQTHTVDKGTVTRDILTAPQSEGTVAQASAS
jgi:hypothetical protein